MVIRAITSPSNDTIKAMKALQLRKYRAETGQFLVEGMRSVREGLDLGAPLQQIVFAETLRNRADMRAFLTLCVDKGVDCIEVSEAILEKLARKDNPQSVIGVFKQQLGQLSDVESADGKNWVVLEQVRDPGNLGTIIRTVDAIAAAGVILLGQCCDPFSVECTRATMGSLFAVRVVQTDLAAFKTHLNGWQGDVLGTTLQPDSVDIATVKPRTPFLLVMGNEQAGLTAETRGLCSKLIKLPMRGRADSLNLSVATGVCLYQLIG